MTAGTIATTARTSSSRAARAGSPDASHSGRNPVCFASCASAGQEKSRREVIGVVRRSSVLAGVTVAGCFAVGLTAPGSVLGAPLPSKYVSHDPAGDQVSTGAGTPTDTGDFLRTAVRHGRHAVVIHSRFNDLDVSDEVVMSVVFFTNQHHRKDNPGFWRLIRVQGTHADLYQAGPVARFSCERLRFSTDPDTNRFFLRVPRACLERPRWARVQVSDDVTVNGPGDMDITHWTEDALTSSGSRGITPTLFRQPK